ncbi:hypothetical protein [Phenylobacterium sp.]|uniref:hypothetical protein n=1 Tax=Phenylobacterium sp. TaxID=1871053 RepID=UPI002CD2F9D3|nr:hypothetical protein [Phenylobacterium sp.]HVI33226.1 hypothetical protein [Phenylobacterium sp.]
MHPFPPAADLQFLIGLEVGQVCLDPWSTQVRFSDGGQITIEGPFEHVDAAGQTHSHQASDEQDVGPVFLRELIQQRITALDSEPRSLTLTFANGALLRISSEEGPYESGQIHPPSGEGGLVVF